MAGKRAGSRRDGTQPPAREGGGLIGPAIGITLSVVAWGYLVYAAIEFGSAARAGDGAAWALLALATLGAAACLFIGLMMITRLTAAIGIDSARSSHDTPRPSTGTRGLTASGVDRADAEVDPSTWEHTLPPTAGVRRSIVPSLGARSTGTSAQNPHLPTVPKKPDPAQGTTDPDGPGTPSRPPTPVTPARPVGGPRGATPAGGRAASRADRPLRSSRRDRPAGGRRAAR